MMYGQNAWVIRTGNDQGFDPDNLDSYYSAVKASGVNYLRIGGGGPNFKPLYSWNSQDTIDDAHSIIYLIDKALANGMEPVIQVGFEPVSICTGNIGLLGLKGRDKQAQIAGSLVRFLKNYYYHNSPPSHPMWRPRYYIIANEPDISVSCTGDGRGFGWNGFGSNISQHADSISTYIKEFSTAMKHEDPSIKIIGPEMSEFSTEPGANSGPLIDSLISSPSPSHQYSIMGIIPTGNGQGKYYVDLVSFHAYFPSANSRQTVILNPAGTSGLGAKVYTTVNNRRGMAQLIAGAGRNISNCRVACTEFNLGSGGGSLDESNSTDFNTLVYGHTNRSYLAGQWLAESFSYAIQHESGLTQNWLELAIPWSVREGNCTESSNFKTFGYISGCSSVNNRKRSTYWHYQMIAKNIRGTFYRGNVTNNAASDSMKVFSGSGCHGVGVMIMNQGPGSHPFVMSYGTNYPTTSNTKIKLNIPNNAWPNYSGVIGPYSTKVLVFDACGTKIDELNYSANKYYHDSVPQRPAGFTPSKKSCMCMKTYNYNSPQLSGSGLRCAVPTETGTAHYNSYAMSGNLKIQDSAYVTGTFTVPSGRTLTIDSAEVVFGTGASILVQSGGQLIISNSNLHGCTDSSWAGIRVVGNSSAGIFTITASRIADAIEAVRTEDVNDPFISGNVIEKNGVGINLIRARGFTIESNEVLNTRLAVKTSSTSNASAAITENLFYESDTCVLFKDDNHSGLDITCNAFINYTDYGIYSTDATLKDQGNSSYGPGNIFVSNSSQTNHQIYFTGPNSVTYYMDPSYMFTLEDELSLLLQEAEYDGACREFSEEGEGGGDGRKKNIINSAKAALANRSLLMNCVPNPTENQVTFNYTLEQNCHSGYLVITDLLGTQVKRIDLDKQAKSVEIQLPEYSSGIYFYSLYADDKLIGTKKLVISK